MVLLESSMLVVFYGKEDQSAIIRSASRAAYHGRGRGGVQR